MPQLGDGTISARNTPPADVLTSVAAIAAGQAHTCALTTSGGVRCWGWNADGEASALHASVCLSLRIKRQRACLCSLEMLQPPIKTRHP